jgi:hypothetical protein
MKTTIITILVVLGLQGCAMQKDGHHNINRAEFDWMPNELMWQNNIRNCRSQPHCRAEDLFRRT